MVVGAKAGSWAYATQGLPLCGRELLVLTPLLSPVRSPNNDLKKVFQEKQKEVDAGKESPRGDTGVSKQENACATSTVGSRVVHPLTGDTESVLMIFYFPSSSFSSASGERCGRILLSMGTGQTEHGRVFNRRRAGICLVKSLYCLLLPECT